MLHCVCGNIRDSLSHAPLIPVHKPWKPGILNHFVSDTFSFCVVLERLGSFSDTRWEIKDLVLDEFLAFLGFRKVQQVIDNINQGLGGRVRSCQVVSSFLVQGSLERYFEVIDNGVEWC